MGRDGGVGAPVHEDDGGVNVPPAVLPLINGAAAAAAESALTDGGWVLGRVVDVDGADITAAAAASPAVHVALDRPARRLSRLAAVMVGSVDRAGLVEPTVVVSNVDDSGADGETLIWHLGPQGAVPLIRDRSVPVSGVRLGCFVAADPGCPRL